MTMDLPTAFHISYCTISVLPTLSTASATNILLCNSHSSTNGNIILIPGKGFAFSQEEYSVRDKFCT